MSAIVTTYKREIVVVKRALDSIINQDYPNIEIIISDNHSDDGTEELIIESQPKPDNIEDHQDELIISAKSNPENEIEQNTSVQL